MAVRRRTGPRPSFPYYRYSLTTNTTVRTMYGIHTRTHRENV